MFAFLVCSLMQYLACGAQWVFFSLDLAQVQKTVLAPLTLYMMFTNAGPDITRYTGLHTSKSIEKEVEI